VAARVEIDEDILAPKSKAPEPAPVPEEPRHPSMTFPKQEPVKIDPDFFAATPAAPKPAPAPVAVPPKVAMPATASHDTTLRTTNGFGPERPDGQPAYLLHEMLPKDAMGVLYRATDRADGRSFAVRFMAGQAGEEQTRAFEKEVEKLVGLPHPNILHVQGSGRRKNRLYVMMDHVTAPTLGAAKISDIGRIVTILRDAASAVHYAHEEGIFHGDLTPESILVDKEENKDKALVKDFGLAYILETQTAALRNPAFLPPEQVRVIRTPLGAAGDVYGLGATLFAALAGRPPFEGDPAKIVKRIMIEEPPPVEKIRPDVPKAVGAVVRRAMAKERSVRYASAGDFADALTKFIEGR
jgi:serine/threonine protein kinase